MWKLSQTTLLFVFLSIFFLFRSAVADVGDREKRTKIDYTKFAKTVTCPKDAQAIIVKNKCSFSVRWNSISSDTLGNSSRYKDGIHSMRLECDEKKDASIELETGQVRVFAQCDFIVEESIPRETQEETKATAKPKTKKGNGSQ